MARTLRDQLRDDVRVARDDPAEWLLLDGHRLTITAVLLGSVFALFVLVESLSVGGVAWPVPLLYVYSSQAGGNITLITLVLSINQLVLSRQLGSPGELLDQIDRVTEYRAAVQNDAGGSVAPVTPSDFLAQLLDNTHDQVESLEDVRGVGDDELDDEIDDLESSLNDHIDEVSGLLNESSFGTFHALSATLDTNYGEQIHQIQRIREDHRGSLDDEEIAELDELVTRLQRIDVARQYFKTLYMQSELATFSRLLLYVGVPATVVSTAVLVLAGGAPEGSFFPSLPPFALALTVTVGFAPLAVLFAFVLRIATVAQRTAAITPFTTPDQRPE